MTTLNHSKLKINKPRSVSRYTYYRLYGDDITGNFLYKKKLHLKSYKSLVKYIWLCIHKPQLPDWSTSNTLNSIITKQNIRSLNKKKTNLVNNINKQQSKRYTLKRKIQLYIARFRQLFNSISMNRLNVYREDTTRHYRYKFLSFLMLWERRVDVTLYRAHMLDKVRVNKGKLVKQKTFLLNGKIIRKFSALLQVNDVVSIHYKHIPTYTQWFIQKLNYLFILNFLKLLRNKFGASLITKESFYTCLIKKILNTWSRNKGLIENNDNFLLSQDSLQFFFKLFSLNEQKSTVYKNLFIKGPYRGLTIQNNYPILYNHPSYFEINWRIMHFTLLSTKVYSQFDIPHLVNINYNLIYNT